MALPAPSSMSTVQLCIHACMLMGPHTSVAEFLWSAGQEIYLRRPTRYALPDDAPVSFAQASQHSTSSLAKRTL